MPIKPYWIPCLIDKNIVKKMHIHELQCWMEITAYGFYHFYVKHFEYYTRELRSYPASIHFTKESIRCEHDWLVHQLQHFISAISPWPNQGWNKTPQNVLKHVCIWIVQISYKITCTNFPAKKMQKIFNWRLYFNCN